MSDRVNDLTDQQLDALLAHSECNDSFWYQDEVERVVAEVRRRRADSAALLANNMTLLGLIAELKLRWERFPSDEAIEAATAALQENWLDGAVRAALVEAKRASTLAQEPSRSEDSAAKEAS